MAAQSVSEQNSPALTPMQRIERLVLTVALVGLIVSGLPQRYLGEPWANALVVLGGGIESLRILHRFFALLLLGEALYHVLALGYRRFVVGRGASLLPG
ncbi:MAG: hypothetical protein JNJ61_26730, partial [Anaerolineae bacterium]|nr:hypothetical protein [Anaerolineae bacterium]